MEALNRRHFLSISAKTAGAALVASQVQTALGSTLSKDANERVNLAIIGCGPRARYVARGLIERGAEVSILCDLHDGRLGEMERFLQDAQPRQPKRVKEMRRVFESKDVDAVIVATPDHWHALPTILACQAGKDVYVEKPHAHNIYESRKMIEAARKYNRIVQVGTQNRSAPYVLAAKEYLQSGKLGKIGLVKVYNLKSGEPFFLGDSGRPPADFNWDAWLGPAPFRPYHEKIFKHGWLNFWDYCNGDLSDDGIHQLDLALMVLGDPGMPSSASSSGGRLVHKDDGEVPDVQIASYPFDNFMMTFEMTNYPRYMQKTTATIRRNDLHPYWTQNSTRVELYGSELMMTIGRMGGGWQVMTSGGRVVDQMYGRPPDDDHYRNFLECVKTRRKPAADIEVAHNAFSMVQLAVIAHKVGCGTVRFDPQGERFVGNEEADKLLKRDYRPGYEIPAMI